MAYPVVIIPTGKAPVKCYNRKQRNKWEKRFKQQEVSYTVVPSRAPIKIPILTRSRKYPVMVIGRKSQNDVLIEEQAQLLCKNHKELHGYVRSLKRQGFEVEEKEGWNEEEI